MTRTERIQRDERTWTRLLENAEARMRAATTRHEAVQAMNARRRAVEALNHISHQS